MAEEQEKNPDKAKARDRLEAERTGDILRGIIQDRPQLEIIVRLCTDIESREEESGLHILRMISFCVEAGRTLELDNTILRRLVLAAVLHDVGKLLIPERILLKTGKLDEFEWTIVKEHPNLGFRLLKSSQYDDLKAVAEIIACHHEKWDGSGYPAGLVEDSIPLLARIVAAADVFDACLSTRAYKSSYPFDTSLNIIRDASASHFDPQVVEAFISRKDTLCSIAENLSPKSQEDPTFRFTEFLEGRR